MKVILNSLFNVMSGKIDSIVLAAYNRVLNVGGKEVSCLGRALGSPTSVAIQPSLNLRLAFQIVATKWKKLNLQELAGWHINAQLISQKHKYDLSGYNLFKAYFLERYLATLTRYVSPTDLSDGSGWGYEHRDTHTWS